MGRLYDNNPWADKLSQVSMPDIGEAWKGMEMLLDKEMPAGRKKDKRRWFLLILLLLLLIGVCNCPERGRFSGDRLRHGLGDSISHVGGGDPEGLAAQGGRDGREQVAGDRERPEQVGSGKDRPELVAGGKGKPERVERGKTKRVVRGKAKPGAEDTKTGSTFGDAVEKQEQADTTGGGGVHNGAAKDSLPGKDSVLLPKAAAKKDSVHKASGKPAPKPPEEKKQKEKGWWTAGIGVNQFFTVGGQQSSHYNSGGISGTLGDYIPVPVIRYHFNRKFYLQLEAQLNSPQYTRKDLVISQPKADSISPTQAIQNSVLIKKLFYFNLPFSIHYNVFRKLDLGAGLQFSRLSNGIGLFENRLINTVTSTTDSISSLSKSFKGDTLYKKIKTNEFRILLDASYSWKSFIFGVRYNQSLSKFINIQVAPGQITQARNSSLQLYLRYILWDNQKKQPSMTK